MQSMKQIRVRGQKRVARLFDRYLDEVTYNRLETEAQRCKVDEVLLDFGEWLCATDSFNNGRYN